MVDCGWLYWYDVCEGMVLGVVKETKGRRQCTLVRGNEDGLERLV